MEEKRNTSIYTMKLRIDTKLAGKIKIKASQERVSANALIHNILNSCIESNLSINVPETFLKELKEEAEKLNLGLQDYIILKLMK